MEITFFLKLKEMYKEPFIGQMLPAVSATDPIKCLNNDLWIISFASQITHGRLRNRARWSNVGSDDEKDNILTHSQ